LKAPLVPPDVAHRRPVALPWLIVLAGANFTFCQALPTSPSQSLLAQHSLQDETFKTAAAPCPKPASLPNISDYDGPLKKTVGVFARPLERKSVHPTRYKPGVRRCSFELPDKFRLFLKESTDPVNMIGTAFNAGLDHASNRDRMFGQGAAGYGRRKSRRFRDCRISQAFCLSSDLFRRPTILPPRPRQRREACNSRGCTPVCCSNRRRSPHLQLFRVVGKREFCCVEQRLSPRQPARYRGHRTASRVRLRVRYR